MLELQKDKYSRYSNHAVIAGYYVPFGTAEKVDDVLYLITKYGILPHDICGGQRRSSSPLSTTMLSIHCSYLASIKFTRGHYDTSNSP